MKYGLYRSSYSGFVSLKSIIIFSIFAKSCSNRVQLKVKLWVTVQLLYTGKMLRKKSVL